MGWLSLHWLILPHIAEWRGPIEARASRLLGTPVRIGKVEVQSSGWIPSLALEDVRVLDAEQRTALSLPRVFATLSPRSLLALEPRFAQLLIDAPSLDVRRDKSGRLRVAGLDVDTPAAAADDDAAADWFFRQHEFVIRAGTLRWIDEARDAAPLVLGGVDLVVRNGLREHDVRLDATPPAEWGERFTLRGRFTQPLFARSGDWRRWSGSLYAELPRADLSELGRRVTLPIELRRGDGALRGWVDIREGEATAAQVDLALRAVDVRLDRSVEPLELEQIEGHVSAERHGERIRVGVHRLSFRTGDGLVWPRGDLDVAWRTDAGDAIVGGEVAADRLDVGVMADIAGRVPLGAALRTLLVDVRPRGLITQLDARWEGPLDAPERYRAKGVLSGLSLSARPSAAAADAIGRPGLENAEIRLDASEAGGQADIAVRRGRLDLPGVFAERVVPLDRLDAKVRWRIERRERGDAEPKIDVKVTDARFANADAQGELSAAWRTGGGNGVARGGRYPGQLELDARLAEMAAARVARYLPLGLPDDVRGYVGRAVRGGSVSAATIRVRGDLWDFPFHDARRDGELRIGAKLDGVTFAYAPDSTSAGGPSSPSGATAPARAGTSATPPAPVRATEVAAAPATSGAANAGAVAESWPPFTAASGELVIDRSSLELKNGRARIGATEWSGIGARIDELGSAKARVDVDAVAQGPLAEMLRIVNASPVGRWIGRSLAATSGSGAAELKLGLAIPLARPAETNVRGTLALPGNDVRMTADTPLLAGAKARIDFTHKGFVVAGGSARVLGGELAFDGGSSNGLAGGDAQRFAGRGTFSADALRQSSELGSLARLATQLSGQAPYRVQLGFAGGRTQLALASNLVGLGIDLPSPFAKAPATALPLRVRIAPDDSGAPRDANAPRRDHLQVELGPVLRAMFVRETAGDVERVVRGAIRVGDGSSPSSGEASPETRSPRPDPSTMPRSTSTAEPSPPRVATTTAEHPPSPRSATAAEPTPPRSATTAEHSPPRSTTTVEPPAALRGATSLEPSPTDPIEPIALPAAGVAATLSLKRLDVDEWRAVADRVTQGEPARTAAPGPTGAAPPLVFDPSGGAGYLPSAIALRVGDLDLGSRHLKNVTAGLTQQGDLWRANVAADELEGYVEYRPARRAGVGAGRVFARLARASLPKGDAERVESLLDAQPSSIPGLDIVVDDFELRGKRLGRLEIEASNRPGGAREWQLSKLNLTMPEAQLAATGTWSASAANAPRRAALTFNLTLADSGALLERLGMGRVVRGGKGSLAGEVSWPGSPLSPDVARMSGQVKVAIDQGQFLKAGPGAARLLGVLSLQSLPRRLLLDFRDVFAEGFAFDNVVGDVRIGQGQASTNNLRMRGVAAAVLMEGSADLERETEELRVLVVPEINAGTASLAYAVINPALGLGTFLAQYFLRKPLMAASTREFRITGPWDDPKVERVERKLFAETRPDAADAEGPSGPVAPAATVPR